MDKNELTIKIASKLGKMSKKDIKKIKSKKKPTIFLEIKKLLYSYVNFFFQNKLSLLISDIQFENILYQLDLESCNDFDFNLKVFLQNIIKQILCVILDETSDDVLTNVTTSIEEILDLSVIKPNKNMENMKDYILHNYQKLIFAYGDSSSGKSTTVAYCIHELENLGYSYTWVDFSKVGLNNLNILYSIIASLNTNTNNHIVVIDNLQSMTSNITTLYKLYEIINQKITFINFKFIFISWKSTKLSFSEIFSQFKIKYFEFIGDELILDILDQNRLDTYRNDIIYNSNNDVLIAQKTVEYIKENNRFPNRSELAEYIYSRFTKENLPSEEKKALFILAALGNYEIHVRRTYLELKTSPDAVVELIRKKLCRSYLNDNVGEFLYLGHRSLANYIVAYFQEKEKKIANELPINLAIEYLKKEGHRQFLSTLKRLDREMLMNESEGIFSIIWNSFVKLRDLLYEQIDRDSTWGDNMASMIFAAEALNMMNFESSANTYLNKTISSIRERWGPNSDKIVYRGDSTRKSTSELIDFKINIKETMEVDESSYSYEENMLSANINYDLFHQNWLLGLLIGFEGISEETDGNLKEAYISIAKRQQNIDGSFYPSRVPWVTSRIVIGLCQAGMTYSDSIVKKSCDWLVSRIKPAEEMNWIVKDFSCSGWRSGTGTWNTNENVTLMNLYALLLAKYPIHQNPTTNNMISFLWEQRHKLEEQFFRSNKYLDIMWILSVFMKDTRNVLLESEEIRALIQEVLDNWENATIASDKKKTESSDVSFMAKELISILWRLLYDNMDELFKRIDRPYHMSEYENIEAVIRLQKKIKPCNRDKKYIFISYRSGRGTPHLCLPVYKDVIFLQSKFHNLFEIFIDISNFDEKFDAEISKAINDANCMGAFVYLSDEYINVGMPENTDRCLVEMKLLNKKRDMNKDMFVIPIFLKNDCSSNIKLETFVKDKMHSMSAATDSVRAEELSKLLSLNKTYDDVGVYYMTWEDENHHFDYEKTSNLRNCLLKNGIEIVHKKY